MKTILRSIGLIMAAIPLSAYAGNQTGTVTMVSTDNNNGPYIFMLSGTHAAQASCATTDGYWVIPTNSNQNADRMVSTILTAFALGKSVTVIGTGTCPDNYPRELVNYIIVN